MDQDTYFQTASFEDVLDDLSCRFIVNIPAEELVSVSRICFQIEQAHWFYEDFIREQNPQLPSLSLRRFSKCIFDHCPLLWQFSGRHEEEFKDFLRYKQRVPVLGGILLDENWDKCILVKAWKGGSWSFPRGKINKDEPDADCAIREVWEETGYDVSSLLLPDAFLELQIKEQRVKLYIIPGVPTDTLMSPQTRKEISMIGWIRLVDLPGYSKRNKQVNPGIKLYMVTPFMSGLRTWISQNRHRKGKSALVEEDGAESAVEQFQEMPEEGGTTDGLIAMLRRPQLQPESEQQVDLLGMLRNRPVTEENTEAPYPYPQHYLGLQDNFPTMLEHSYPERHPTYTQQQPQSPVEATSNQGPFDSVRRNSLLSILKGGGSQFTPSEDKTTTPSLLDILKGPLSPPPSNQLSFHPSEVADPAKAEHQRSLLSALKSPTIPYAEPAVPMVTATTVHQNALLAALTSPKISQSVPPTSHHDSLLSALKSPTLPAAPPNSLSTHQSSLLSALKSPPQRRSVPTPPEPSVPSSHQSSLLSTLKSPSPEVPKTAPVSTHQNALLSSLKSPSVVKTTNAPPPEVPKPAVQPRLTSTHQNALLSALKTPPIEKSTPPPELQATETATAEQLKPMSSHQNALLSALKSPPVAKTTPAPAQVPVSPSGSVHKNALLSALTSPKLAQSTPPAVSPKNIPTIAPQEPVSTHQNALLSALRSPPSQKTSPAIAEDVRASTSSIHQNALLAALKSPPAGVMATATEPENKSPTEKTDNKNTPLAVSSSPIPEASTASTGSAAKSTYTISLFDRFKRSPPQNTAPSPAIETAATPALDENEAEDVAEEVPRLTSPPISTLAPTPPHQISLLASLKSPTQSISPAPKPEQQISLLDALRGSSAGVTKEDDASDDKLHEVKSVHVASLLERLRSPTLEKSVPPVTSSAPAVSFKTTTENPVVGGPVMNGKGISERRSKSPQQQRRQSPQRRQTPTTSVLLDTLKPNKSKTPSPPSSIMPVPPPTATSNSQTHQTSLLSLLNPTSTISKDAPTPAGTTNIAEDKTQPKQFNFSQSPQIGKKQTFKQVLRPTGVSDVESKKSNGTVIDLGKMTLLKRPAQPGTIPGASQPTQPEPATVSIDNQEEPSTPVTKEREEVTSPQSPMGIEFPFKRRSTPGRSISTVASGKSTPSPTVQKEKETEKSKGNVQSLLSLLRGGSSKSETATTAVETGTSQEESAAEAEVKGSEPKSEESTIPKRDDRINSLLRVFAKPHPNTQTLSPPASSPVEASPQQNGSEKGDSRERKLVAMLERALSKGVPTSSS